MKSCILQVGLRGQLLRRARHGLLRGSTGSDFITAEEYHEGGGATGAEAPEGIPWPKDLSQPRHRCRRPGVRARHRDAGSRRPIECTDDTSIWCERSLRPSPSSGATSSRSLPPRTTPQRSPLTAGREPCCLNSCASCARSKQPTAAQAFPISVQRLASDVQRPTSTLPRLDPCAPILRPLNSPAELGLTDYFSARSLA